MGGIWCRLVVDNYRWWVNLSTPTVYHILLDENPTGGITANNIMMCSYLGRLQLFVTLMETLYYMWNNVDIKTSQVWARCGIIRYTNVAVTHLHKFLWLCRNSGIHYSVEHTVSAYNHKVDVESWITHLPVRDFMKQFCVYFPHLTPCNMHLLLSAVKFRIHNMLHSKYFPWNCPPPISSRAEHMDGTVKPTVYAPQIHPDLQ